MQAPARILTAIGTLVVFLAAAPLTASGPVGIYGIVEKVVFEPDSGQAERIQIWGAFAYVEGSPGQSLAISPAARGYLYLRLPAAGPASDRTRDTIRNEWADLKSVAGTGQVVGFGQWGYIGGFGALNPDVSSRNPPYIYEESSGRPRTDLRVRPPSESPAAPALYQTNVGVVKIPDTGSHAAIVRQLRDALKQERR